MPSDSINAAGERRGYSSDTINKAGGHRPLLGGPPNYRPNRSQDWPPAPEPLRPCDRCDQHAALFGPDDRGTYYCGLCIGRVDIFHSNMVHVNSALQMRADQELAKAVECNKP